MSRRVGFIERTFGATNPITYCRDAIFGVSNVVGQLPMVRRDISRLYRGSMKIQFVLDSGEGGGNAVGRDLIGVATNCKFCYRTGGGRPIFTCFILVCRNPQVLRGREEVAGSIIVNFNVDQIAVTA